MSTSRERSSSSNVLAMELFFATFTGEYRVQIAGS
jgi:hypothetical protein